MNRILVLLILVLLQKNIVFSQEKKEKNIVQFTGLIFNSDSTMTIKGVHIYTPKARRGTVSNPYGFFSGPFIEGDSIVFSAVGFKNKSVIIPYHNNNTSLKYIIVLEEDTSFMNEVEVFPYPTEAIFKAAILGTHVPDPHYIAYLDKWMNSTAMKSMYANMPESGKINYRNYILQQNMAYNNRFQATSIPITNPFAWVSFIRTLINK